MKAKMSDSGIIDKLNMNSGKKSRAKQIQRKEKNCGLIRN